VDAFCFTAASEAKRKLGWASVCRFSLLCYNLGHIGTKGDFAMKVTGRVWKYGANVDTDAIIAARYLDMSDGAELAKHAMEDLDSGFASAVRPGDIIVATTNFGCGSSREHAPLALKSAGIGCVIAETFARIFYRNAINIALPILECPEATAGAETGHELEVDLTAGRIHNLTTGDTYEAKPYPQFMMDIMDAGGLMAKTVRDLGKQQSIQ
jgi:3-isopropylmalate/(R)-2-methylmalate dehydratase small subunit